MILRRGSIADSEWNHRENNKTQKPSQLLKELREMTAAIAQFSTQIISPYRSALNDLFGECSQLCHLLDCLLAHQQRSHHLILLSEDDLLFTYIDKLTALQTNLSLILQNVASSANDYPALWGAAQDISESLRDFAQINRNAAVIAASHCRREFKHLFGNNCQQSAATLIAARALLVLAGIQPQNSCNVYQRSDTPDQLIFFYECLEEKAILKLHNWLLNLKVKSSHFKKDENKIPVNISEPDFDSEGTANFQFEEEIVVPVNASAYELILDAAEFSSAIMPLVRAQAVQLSKTPRSQSFSAVLISSGSLWSSQHSSSAETSKNASDDEELQSSEHEEQKQKLREILQVSHKLTQPGSGRTTPRSATQSPRTQKNGSGMLTALKSLGSSAE